MGHIREERVFRHVGGLGLGKGVAQHGTVLEFAGIGLAQLGVHRLQLVGPLAQLVRGVVDEHVEELARVQRDVVAVVLYPTHRAVAADDAVLHVVHGVPVGLNLTADGVLHGLDVLGVHHAGEGAARQRDELLLVSAAEDAQAGLVDVDHRLGRHRHGRRKSRLAYERERRRCRAGLKREIWRAPRLPCAAFFCRPKRCFPYATTAVAQRPRSCR